MDMRKVPIIPGSEEKQSLQAFEEGSSTVPRKVENDEAGGATIDLIPSHEQHDSDLISQPAGVIDELNGSSVINQEPSIEKPETG